ncbi:MAG: hypothetical protein NC338_02085 [Firmicutes bacterium]|nr:hypothetical protein [Bacillota bacterium]MCM1400651.1 hypothetical protein [Bacteroides sp.]
MKFISPGILFITLCCVLAGCGSDEPFKHLVIADSPEMFNVVAPAGGARGSASITEGVSYYITFDDEKRDATLTINNIQLSPSSPPEIITFSNIVWTYEPGSHEKRRIIEAAELHSDGAPGADVTLTDVVIIYTESNELNPEPTAGFYASYTVDNLYRVTSYPYRVEAFGTTTVSNPDSVVQHMIYYDPVYAISFNPRNFTASIHVASLELAGSGESLVDLDISGLKLGLDPEGYTMQATSSSKVVASTGADVSLGDLSATANLRDQLDLTFEITVNGKQYLVEAYLPPDLNALQ